MNTLTTTQTRVNWQHEKEVVVANDPWNLPKNKTNGPTFYTLAGAMPVDDIKEALGQRSLYHPTSENRTMDKKDATVNVRVSSDMKKLTGYIVGSQHLPFRTESDIVRFYYYLGAATLLPIAEEIDPILSVRMLQALSVQEMHEAVEHSKMSQKALADAKRVLDDPDSSEVLIAYAKNTIKHYTEDSDNKVREKAEKLQSWIKRSKS